MMKPSEINASEYNPYYKNYIGLVKDIPLMEALELGLSTTPTFFKSIPSPKIMFRYAEGKWTPKDILLHIIDTERVFAYRALYFSRSENADLEGFDENIFALNAVTEHRDLLQLTQEYIAVREATISFFKSFSGTELKKMGKANKNLLSVGAAGFIICGHEIHHCNIINERYL